MTRSTPLGSDEALALRAAQDDREAFTALVRRYQDRIYTVALRLTRNSARASEIAQQAFLRAWENRAAFNGRWRYATWLYRIATNLCADEYRRQALRQRVKPEVEVREPDQPLLILEESETRSRLSSALDRLPYEMRAALVLRYIDDLPYREIARVRGIPVNTLKGHLQRGKTLLREYLKNKEGER